MKEPALPQQVISGLAELLSSQGDTCQHLGNGTGVICSPGTAMSAEEPLTALRSSKYLLQQEDEGGRSGSSSLCQPSAEQEAVIPAPLSGAHDQVLMCSRDTVTILALPAVPCGFCGLLSSVQQMISVDAGPSGDALWLVAYGNLWTPLAAVTLSLIQLQGTDPATFPWITTFGCLQC